MKALAVIPARGGSRGIAQKNLAPLVGRPLIEWTIDAGLEAQRVQRVVVSSDDPNILKVASRCGAEVLRRPSELAADQSRSEPVLAHALEALSDGAPLAVFLQPTSPLRTSEDIDGALALLEDDHVQAVISVSEPTRSPFKAFYADAEGFLRPVARDADAPFRPRQTLPQAWFPNGAIYAVRTEEFRRAQTFLPPRTVPFAMPRERSLDVDTPSDLEQVERLWSHRMTTALAG